MPDNKYCNSRREGDGSLSFQVAEFGVKMPNNYNVHRAELSYSRAVVAAH